MYRIETTALFDLWLARLRDVTGKAAVIRRLHQAAAGHFGDCKAVGEGVREMRIHTGPGYRLYFIQRGDVLIVFLAGGDKSTQQRDIARALNLAAHPPPERTAMKTTPFDAARFLDSEEVIAEYLAQVLAENDDALLLTALNDIARARGMSRLARESGISREALYRALAPGARPRFETIRRITNALGVRLTAAASVPAV